MAFPLRESVFPEIGVVPRLPKEQKRQPPIENLDGRDRAIQIENR